VEWIPSIQKIITHRHFDRYTQLKWCVVLSDIFVFGIYFTQAEFVDQIL
jgi:hypothetical protein